MSNCALTANLQVLHKLYDMGFSFSKPDFKSGLRANGSMMTGNACVAYLILGNRNWVSLLLLTLIGLSLTLLTSMSITFSKDSPHD